MGVCLRKLQPCFDDFISLDDNVTHKKKSFMPLILPDVDAVN